MKIVSEKEDLLKGIQVIQSAVTSRTGTIPVLQNFLIETEKEGIRIISTDLEIAIKHFVKTDIKTPGSVTLPMKKFNEIVQNFDDNTVSLFADENAKVTVNSGRAKIKIAGLPKTDYPLIPEINEKDCFELNANQLSEMIEKTVFSVSNEEERQFLNGLLWEKNKDVLSIVATDGRRMAVYRKNKIGAKRDFRVIIPAKIMNELARFLKANAKNEKETLKIDLSTNQAGFIFGKTVFISKFIEGNFPDYERIIPKEFNIAIKIDSKKLLSATKRAAICSNERNSSVRYSFKKGIMIITSSSQNIDFEDEFEIDYKGEDFHVNYNPKFILDILKNVSGKMVEFSFSDPGKPSVIKDCDNSDLLYVVMPLRQ